MKNLKITIEITFVVGDYQECLDICSKFCSGSGSQNKGILISGGHPSSKGRKVELLNLKTKSSCELPDLPEARWGHTSVEGIICGGAYLETIQTSCIDIKMGSWSSSRYQQIRQRYHHVRWNIKPGESFMLLGSHSSHSQSRRTTDIVYRNGVVTPGFNLKYDAT